MPISLPSIIDPSPGMMTVTSTNTLSPLDLNERFNNAEGKNYTFTPSPHANV